MADPIDGLPTRPLPEPHEDDRLKLVVLVDGVAQARPLPSGGAVVIGRADACEVPLKHDSLSRRHAVLHLGPEARIEDLGSLNGTWLQGQRLAPNVPAPLPVDTPLTLGSVVLMLARAAAQRPSRVEQQNAAGMVIRASAMKALVAEIEQLARGPINVLLLGETGVGKEVLARLLHERSPRRAKPFVAVNCPAVPEQLVEAELFGHERGAFTGANDARTGIIESAEGGTVFLDEVGELPLPVQAKLLRVLEERVVCRVGARQSRAVNVRFVAATNRDLEAEVAAGRFRRDLYYRLNSATLTVPPLRRRHSEIVPLAEQFVASYAHRLDVPAPRIGDGALQRLRAHDWPGNIRELRNVIERAVLVCGGRAIQEQHLRLASVALAAAAAQQSADIAEGDTLPVVLATVERERIEAALAAYAGNQTRAAKVLGLTRRQLGIRMTRFGLPRPRKQRQSRDCNAFNR